MLEKYPIVEFQCACSLKEAEFLDLLRSTFPQLAGETLGFLAGNDANVKPIDIKNQTSDEISQSLRLAGNSFLCIQIKVRSSFLSGYVSPMLWCSGRETCWPNSCLKLFQEQQEAPTGVKRSHSVDSDQNRHSPR